jgi:hypothetical protein
MFFGRERRFHREMLSEKGSFPMQLAQMGWSFVH